MKRSLTRASFVGLSVALGLLASSPAIAGETDDVVDKVLRDRSATFCKAVLPAWLISKHGVHDPKFRAIVVDCYLSQARLAVLGTSEKDRAIENTALSELPAGLLQARTGMNLDMYGPLAGITLLSRPAPQ